MPSFTREVRTFLSLSLATLALVSGCRDCPVLSCESPVIVRLNLPATVQLGDQAVACHLDTCVTGSLLATTQPGYFATLSFPTGASVTGWVKTREDGSLQMVVNWGTPATQGDRYTLTVSDGSGTEVASLDVTAMIPQADMSSGGCPMCFSVYLGDPA